MRKTHFIAPLLAVLLTGGSISLAQAMPGSDAGHGPGGPSSRAEILFDSWQLDEATRKAYTEEQHAYREQRHTLREQHQQRLADILSDDQLAALRAMLAPRHAPQGGHKMHGPDAQEHHD